MAIINFNCNNSLVLILELHVMLHISHVVINNIWICFSRVFCQCHEIICKWNVKAYVWGTLLECDPCVTSSLSFVTYVATYIILASCSQLVFTTAVQVATLNVTCIHNPNTVKL